MANTLLLLKKSSLDGKHLRLEREVGHLSSKLKALLCKSMQKNLVFYNIQESQGEDCELVIVNLLTEEMNISLGLIYSPKMCPLRLGSMLLIVLVKEMVTRSNQDLWW